MTTSSTRARRFYVELIKPSHYDDDGYLIQWVRAFVPSNSLACVLSLVEQVKAERGLGDDVELIVKGYDEGHTVVPVERIIRRIKRIGGVVMLVGVQTNQFPRARQIARQLRAAGVQVAIGGFHVSGCAAMLPELPGDIKEVQALGVSLFLGEAEGRMTEVLRDALDGRLKPVYDYLSDLPDLQGAAAPALPREIARRYMLYTSFDTGRGCPFECSFCTIINVQGRKSRYRSADDVERIVRIYWERGVRRFFITDDDFARNKNWEDILDRLIELREKHGMSFKFITQVDTACHKIPRFVEKAARAGCNQVFIGLENINPANLKAAHKRQNKIAEYRDLLMAWREHRVMTIAGYILGFPEDTAESIRDDVRTIQEELPIDIMQFMVLTPLPGSEDHKKLVEAGVWLHPDMNRYDLEHSCTNGTARMTGEEIQAAYHDAWDAYYSPDHVETLVKRGEAYGAGARKVASMIWQFYGSQRVERVHPQQCGIVRVKRRRLRRPELPRESPLIFYPRYAWEVAAKSARTLAFWWRLRGLRSRVRKDPRAKAYVDRALCADRTIQPFGKAGASPAIDPASMSGAVP